MPSDHDDSEDRLRAEAEHITEGVYDVPAIETRDEFKAAIHAALLRVVEEERDFLLPIVHHMTLMLSDFGAHDPACHCSFEQTRHAADCKDCECGLREAIEFGVEQSGFPLEPEPMTPEEEARLHEIGARVVEKVLAEFKSRAIRQRGK